MEHVKESEEFEKVEKINILESYAVLLKKVFISDEFDIDINLLERAVMCKPEEFFKLIMILRRKQVKLPAWLFNKLLWSVVFVPAELVALMADPAFDLSQICEIQQKLMGKPPYEQAKFYVRPDLSLHQIEEIVLGFSQKLSIEQVELYADPKFDYKQMRLIREGFKKGFSMEQVKLYADPRFSPEQMQEIMLGFEHGLSLEEVKLYTNPELSAEQMREIRLGLEYGRAGKNLR